tara:strand:- start:571 stop:852 length:282 start_codon:yes stop_codon:yes gene_type:complete
MNEQENIVELKEMTRKEWDESPPAFKRLVALYSVHKLTDTQMRVRANNCEMEESDVHAAMRLADRSQKMQTYVTWGIIGGLVFVLFVILLIVG